MNKVSVVVPLFNKANWIERCVDSALKQTHSNIEIIVVDDGSTDKGAQRVLNIADSRINLLRQNNRGPSAARNVGIEKASGDFIAFLDADDEWRSRHLECLLKGFALFPDAILVCDELTEVRKNEVQGSVGSKTPSPSSQVSEEKIEYKPIEDYLETLAQGRFILSGSSVLIRSSFREDGLLKFLKQSEPAEDMNLWIRLAKRGDFIYCNYRGALYHRVDPGSLMNRQKHRADKVPPYFFGVDPSSYNRLDRRQIHKFLRREYLKKAFQNRGLRFVKGELNTQLGPGFNLGPWLTIPYVAVRFVPKLVFNVLQRFRTAWT